MNLKIPEKQQYVVQKSFTEFSILMSGVGIALLAGLLIDQAVGAALGILIILGSLVLNNNDQKQQLNLQP